jgi:copper(I)-binding protein
MRWLGPVLALMLAQPALAHEYTAGGLEIGHPYAIETAATAKTAAGYLSVTNSGAEADRLLAVEAAFPRVEVHETRTDADGVARMLPVEAVEIPPGATVTLAPRGMHVMFMGLEAPWTAGEEIPATLVFERAGKVPVVFAVEPREAAMDGMDDDMPGMDEGMGHDMHEGHDDGN